jgi:hypothetical protein
VKTVENAKKINLNLCNLLVFIFPFFFSFSCIRGEDYNWNVDQYCIDTSADPFIMNVIWGANEFLAADSCGIYKSVNGKEWSELSASGMYPYPLKLTWGNGQYVGFSEGLSTFDNWIGVSPDGINWSETAFVANNNYGLLDISWGNNEYIAVGDDGLVMTSIDAITWVTLNSNISKPIASILYANGFYYALVGSRGRSHDDVYRSVDAQTWEIVNLPYDDCTLFQNKSGIAYGSEGFVVSGTPESFYSGDGKNWQKIEPPLSMDQVTFCAGSNKYFGAKSGGGWFDAPKVFFSDDGKNWEEHWIGNWGYVAEKYFNVYSVACNDDNYVVGGTCTDNIFLGWSDFYSCIMYSP